MSNLFRSVVVKEPFAVDQRPQQILRPRRASSATLQVFDAALQFRGAGRAAQRHQIQFGDQFAVRAAAQNGLGDTSAGIRDGVGNSLAVKTGTGKAVARNFIEIARQGLATGAKIASST
jgi:hypothetical protein